MPATAIWFIVLPMLSAFFIAAVGTMAVGGLAWFAASFFSPGTSARVATFGIALGFALGRYSYSGPASIAAPAALAAVAGAAVALIILWAVLLRKSSKEA